MLFRSGTYLKNEVKISFSDIVYLGHWTKHLKAYQTLLSMLFGVLKFVLTTGLGDTSGSYVCEDKFEFN